MVGIYCRISKQKEAGKDVSIAVQRNEGITFAKTKGLNFRIFIDEGVSGADDKISNRPEFALLLEAIKKQEIKVVYCYDQSRIERNNRVWNMFLSLMLEKKCEYYPGGKLLDLDVPENQFVTGVMSLANEFYAALTGIKVKEAINMNAKKGKAHGLTAYGYTKDENGYFKIDTKEAEIVKRIFKLSLEGTGTYTIGNILNEDGIPTRFRKYKGQIKRVDKLTKKISVYDKGKVRWRGNVIHDIIRNPIYKGTRIWNNESVSVPPIFSEEYWQEVNDNLEKNKKKVGKREEYQYLINGIIFCDECGSEYRGKKRLKGNDNSYKCKGKSKHYITCNSRGISLPKLETFIIQHLFISKELEKFLVSLSSDKKENDKLKSKCNQIKEELNGLKKVNDRLRKRLNDPDLDDDDPLFNDYKNNNRKLKSLDEKLMMLENTLIERDSNSRSQRIKNTIGKYKLTSGFEDTRNLVHSLIEKITIGHRNKEPKGGCFLIKIEYKGFDEYSIFYTDWQAMRWIQLGHYASKAVTQEDLEDDKDLIRYFAEKKGVKVEIPEDFVGFEKYSAGGTIIELKREELIDFDMI